MPRGLFDTVASIGVAVVLGCASVGAMSSVTLAQETQPPAATTEVPAATPPVEPAASTATPATAVLPAAKPEEVKAFKEAPSNLLSLNPLGGVTLALKVRALALADSSTVEVLISLAKTGTPAQQQAVGAGLAMSRKESLGTPLQVEIENRVLGSEIAALENAFSRGEQCDASQVILAESGCSVMTAALSGGGTAGGGAAGAGGIGGGAAGSSSNIGTDATGQTAQQFAVNGGGSVSFTEGNDTILDSGF